MTYYSCRDFLIILFIIAQERLAELIAPSSGPRGIRTLDLLNAIETRSQLRYGPLFNFCDSEHRLSNCPPPSGPEGIRTPGLLSAIEARSQLRYRPIHKARRILLYAVGYVKRSIL